MGKIWAVVGGAMTIIGIGGLSGDLRGWGDMLRITNVGGDVWWTLLMVVGFGLLVINLVPRKQWSKLYKRLPLTIRRRIALPIGTDKVTGFYSTRTSMADKYGGISWELRNAKVIWACWPGASTVAHSPPEQVKKVKRLLLRHPKSSEVEPYAEISGSAHPADIVSDITFATRVFEKAGGEVRWYSAPLTSITIGDPDSDDPWARVEVQLFGDSDVWQNYLVYRRHNQVAYESIKGAFERMWNSKWSCPPTLNSKNAEL